ncbi:cysteine desulfurase family protein [Nonomuraea sp. MCN248]|uniref:Cysteine desulfurase family protein n=1 Tax=Nonomuraea corallina TaxID=2989783 RepID=A0ABT4SJ69_9ACTN|nr:cysteine desulfurase family protein [Nonomuraea corallina]MDA0636995.1 cysteine desulfurase family protein [Nonomuraea corallina]
MKIIYLDNCATTRVDDEVVDAMLPFLREDFGNPSSPHLLGKRARRAVDAATESVARLIGADPEDLVFTSGATESNNLALLGMFGHEERAPVNAAICPTDHKSSLSIGRALAGRGLAVRAMRVGGDGRIDLGHLAGLLDPFSRVATACWVNSEIGTIQPVRRMAALCHDAGALLHVDGAQAAGRIPIDVREAGVDTMAMSGHKLRGPKGVGALYVRPEIRRRLRPVLFGGGQYALRSGTIPTHLVVGMGKACELAAAGMADAWRRVRELRATALDLLMTGFPGVRVNGAPDGDPDGAPDGDPDGALNGAMNGALNGHPDGHPDGRVPHVLNVVLPGVRGESLVSSLRSVALSTGSACNSGSQEPSHVLTAIGLDAEDANSSVRICLDSRMPAEDLVLGLELVLGRARALAGVVMTASGPRG